MHAPANTLAADTTVGYIKGERIASHGGVVISITTASNNMQPVSESSPASNSDTTKRGHRGNFFGHNFTATRTPKGGTTPVPVNSGSVDVFSKPKLAYLVDGLPTSTPTPPTSPGTTSIITSTNFETVISDDGSKNAVLIKIKTKQALSAGDYVITVWFYNWYLLRTIQISHKLTITVP